jgi:NADH-quinone oxidoreductase subunit E
MAFVLSAERKSILESLRPRYPNAKALTIPLLHLCQEQEGWCSPEVVDFVAAELGVPGAHVQGVVTFYTMFLKEKPGKRVLWVCRTLSCELRGAREIQQHLEQKLGVHVGQTTPDGEFTLMKAECLAACGQGPMIQLDDEFFENLTTSSVDRVLDNARKSPPKAPGVCSSVYLRPEKE